MPKVKSCLFTALSNKTQNSFFRALIFSSHLQQRKLRWQEGRIALVLTRIGYFQECRGGPGRPSWWLFCILPAFSVPSPSTSWKMDVFSLLRFITCLFSILGHGPYVLVCCSGSSHLNCIPAQLIQRKNEFWQLAYLLHYCDWHKPKMYGLNVSKTIGLGNYLNLLSF